MSNPRAAGGAGAPPAGRHPPRFLYLARAAWLLIGVPTLALLLLSLPPHYRELKRGFIGIDMERSAGRGIVIGATNLNAQRAGIQRGDTLIAVDGVPISPGETVPQLGFERLRGELGTSVRLTIVRAGQPARDYTVVRSRPELQALRHFGLGAAGVTRYNFLLRILPSIAFLVLALAIAWHGRHNPLGWLLSLAMLLMASLSSAYWGASAALTRQNPALVVPVDLLEAIALAGTVLMLCLFPDGRWVPRWTRPFAWLAGAWFLTGPWNPLMRTRYAWLAINITMVICLVAQVQRYRVHATLVQRQQTKWATFGVVVALATYVLFDLSALTLGALGRRDIMQHLVAIQVPIASVAATLIPATIALAVTRHRLWNVDTVLNRSAVYSLVTLTLALVWTGMAVLLQAYLELFLGEYSAIAAAAVSSVQVAVLFQPVRQRTQQWVDRRIPRESTVVAAALDSVAAELDTTIDPAALVARLGARTSELLHAQGAAVLLRRADGGLDVAYDSGTLQRVAAAEIAAVSDDTRPARIAAGRVALVVPLRVRRSGTPIALLALGERRDGRRYTSEVRQVLLRFGMDVAPLLVMALRERHLLERVERMLEGDPRVAADLSRR